MCLQIKRARQETSFTAHVRDSYKQRALEGHVKTAWQAAQDLAQTQPQEGEQTMLDQLMSRMPSSVQALCGVLDEAELEAPASAAHLEQALNQLTSYLRSTHVYCTFCGCQYDTAEELQDQCPGLLAEDH